MVALSSLLPMRSLPRLLWMLLPLLALTSADGTVIEMSKVVPFNFTECGKTRFCGAMSPCIGKSGTELEEVKSEPEIGSISSNTNCLGAFSIKSIPDDKKNCLLEIFTNHKHKITYTSNGLDTKLECKERTDQEERKTKDGLYCKKTIICDANDPTMRAESFPNGARMGGNIKKKLAELGCATQPLMGTLNCKTMDQPPESYIDLNDPKCYVPPSKPFPYYCDPDLEFFQYETKVPGEKVSRWFNVAANDTIVCKGNGKWKLAFDHNNKWNFTGREITGARCYNIKDNEQSIDVNAGYKNVAVAHIVMAVVAVFMVVW